MHVNLRDVSRTMFRFTLMNVYINGKEVKSMIGQHVGLHHACISA